METEYEKEDSYEENSSEEEDDLPFTFISMKTVYNYANGYDERWTNKKGVLHREDGPAYTSFQNGMVRIERWHCNGLLHRENGPAVIYYHPDKERKILAHKEFHVQGKQVI